MMTKNNKTLTDRDTDTYLRIRISVPSSSASEIFNEGYNSKEKDDFLHKSFLAD